MNCDLTERVSLLIDGELAPQEAARLRAHVEGCAACRESQEASLLFRGELRSYRPALDPRAQREALASILSSRTPERETAAAPASSQVRGLSTPGGLARRLAERLAETLDGRLLRPAALTALALLLIACVFAVRWFLHPHAGSRTPAPEVSRTESPAPPLPPPGAPNVEEAKKAQRSGNVDEPAMYQANAQKSPRPVRATPDARVGREAASASRDGYRAGRRRREASGGDLSQEAARASSTLSPPAPPSAFEPVAAGSVREVAADPAQRIGRHAEQVEMLLRSFRNARLTEGDPTLDVAGARRLSKRLLYNNITLRREAAGAGDLPVEGLLDSVEPTLLDISNLPDKPSHETVASIKERIRRRQLVGALQAQAMQASP